MKLSEHHYCSVYLGCVPFSKSGFGLQNRDFRIQRTKWNTKSEVRFFLADSRLVPSPPALSLVFADIENKMAGIQRLAIFNALLDLVDHDGYQLAESIDDGIFCWCQWRTKTKKGNQLLELLAMPSKLSLVTHIQFSDLIFACQDKVQKRWPGCLELALEYQQCTGEEDHQLV